MEENEDVAVSELNSEECGQSEVLTETAGNVETTPINENDSSSTKNVGEEFQQETSGTDEVAEAITSENGDLEDRSENLSEDIEEIEHSAESLPKVVEEQEIEEVTEGVRSEEIELAEHNDDENSEKVSGDISRENVFEETPCKNLTEISTSTDAGNERVAVEPDATDQHDSEIEAKNPPSSNIEKSCSQADISGPSNELTRVGDEVESTDIEMERSDPVEETTAIVEAMEVDNSPEATISESDRQELVVELSSEITKQSEGPPSTSQQVNDVSDSPSISKDSSQNESAVENTGEITGRVIEETAMEAVEKCFENSGAKVPSTTAEAAMETDPVEKSFENSVDQVSSSAEVFQSQTSVSECQTEPDLEMIEKPSREKPKLVLLSSSLMSSSAPPVQVVDDEPDIICILPHDKEVKLKPPSSMRPPDLKMVTKPILQLCTHCKQIKECMFKLGNYMLCSRDCHKLLLAQTAEALAQRVCQQCRSSITSTQFIWETMDFCSDICIAHHQMFIGSRCTQCDCLVPSESLGKLSLRFGCDVKQFCGRACFLQYKKILPLCRFCDDSIITRGLWTLESREFCSSVCLKKYETATCRGEGRFNPCAVCNKIELVAIEVQQGDRLNSLCSEPCFSAFKFVKNITEARCDQCQKFFDKVLSDKIMIFMDEWPLQFCAKTCLNIFMMENRQVLQCVVCKVKKNNFDLISKATPLGPIYTCSLPCLRGFMTCTQCGRPGNPKCVGKLVEGSVKFFCTNKCGSVYKEQQKLEKIEFKKMAEDEPGKQEIFQQIMVKPRDHVEMKNKGVLCKPYMHNKGASCRPMPCHMDTQTDDTLDPPKLIPIPVPIYIPAPMAMYSTIFPVPVPVPLPLPIPIFIPTTRNSSKGILKEIRKIHDKMPADPFEAELLMMAEMVAGDKKLEVTDSESDREDAVGGEVNDTYSPEAVDTNNSFGDDIMQMALFASDLAEPQVDMESVLTSNTITPSQHPTDDKQSLYGAVPDENAHTIAMRNRKRPARGGRGGGTPQQNKRGRRSNTPNDVGMHHNMHHNMGMNHLPPPEPQRLEVEKPDAHLQLKYTFGVNAWRHWVMQKNQELEKAMLSNRKIKPFKPDLLQLTADELNFSLCLFVKEVKKPNGQEYAPDTIYYLCLGIQQYLFENNRIDNIFTDIYYEKFTDCLDEVAKKFSALYNDSQFIVTRVEEEHLWESRQLGAHSPHVLLSTLMFFNTKHFNLLTVEEHMQLSFSHIMKHWKRNPNTPGMVKVPGSRNVLLRFYPPQAALEANSRKKKVYEQLENEVDPLRCPVKLYEFYLSKCPESVKTRNDVFYLLPERSCVPDSPVWYSTMALGKEPLMKMLHRVKMVKEINVALLDS